MAPTESKGALTQAGGGRRDIAVLEEEGHTPAQRGGEPPALCRLAAVASSYNNVALQHRQRRQHLQHVGAGSNFVGRWNQCV